jgi:hypothetical protein
MMVSQVFLHKAQYDAALLHASESFKAAPDNFKGDIRKRVEMIENEKNKKRT